MTPKSEMILHCQRCGKPQPVPASDTEFRCKECGKWNPISQLADVHEADHALAELEEQVASLTKLLQEPRSLPQESVQEMKKISERIEDLLSRIRPIFGKVRVSPEDQLLVSLDKVKHLNEADLESGITFSMLTLFLGLTIQELLNQKHWTSTVTALTLSTLVLGGYAVYAFVKALRRKRQVIKETEANALLIDSVVVTKLKDSQP